MSSDKNERVNMFDKASEDRRKRFIEENEQVADDMMATQVTTSTKNKALDFFAKKPKITKDTYSYYVETKVEEFFLGLAEVMEVSKSEVANQLMIMTISENPIILELAEKDKKVKDLLDKFNK